MVPVASQQQQLRFSNPSMLSQPRMSAPVLSSGGGNLDPAMQNSSGQVYVRNGMPGSDNALSGTIHKVCRCFCAQE